jgi:hypothetical protein
VFVVGFSILYLKKVLGSWFNLTLLDSNTNFTIISNKPLKIQAEFTLAEEGGDYSNIMFVGIP